MLTVADMRAIARDRIGEAAVLVRAGHYDTAVYLCGYAVELSLKARVCRTLGWAEFPNEPKEWGRHYAFLKVHDLQLLRKWTGYDARLDAPAYTRHWDEVRQWTPETRYRLAGQHGEVRALAILWSTRVLVDLLNPR